MLFQPHSKALITFVVHSTRAHTHKRTWAAGFWHQSTSAEIYPYPLSLLFSLTFLFKRFRIPSFSHQNHRFHAIILTTVMLPNHICLCILSYSMASISSGCQVTNHCIRVGPCGYCHSNPLNLFRSVHVCEPHTHTKRINHTLTRVLIFL